MKIRADVINVATEWKHAGWLHKLVSQASTTTSDLTSKSVTLCTPAQILRNFTSSTKFPYLNIT